MYTHPRIQGGASQLSDKEYRKHCDRVIDNDGSMENMHASVDEILRGFGI